MVALQIKRARLGFVGGKCATGAAQEWHIIVNRFSVEHDGDMAVDECDVVRLPFAGGFFGGNGRRDSAVDAAHAMRVEWLAVGGGDLNFIDAAQVDAAVAALGHHDFECEVKVFEGVFGAQVSVVFVRLTFFLHGIIDQRAVDDAPAVGMVGIDQFPLLEIAAVEQGDGVAEGHRRQVGFGREGRDAFSREGFAINASAVPYRVARG